MKKSSPLLLFSLLALVFICTSSFAATYNPKEYEVTAFYKPETTPHDVIVLNERGEEVPIKTYLIRTKDIKTGTYKVTKISNNLYKTEDFFKPIYFKTKYCFEYAFRREAQIEVKGAFERTGTIRFK